MPEGRVAIVGSGFAGSILARVLRRIGFEVVLLEKGRHPRFALGESSTPLGNFCLERLATRYGLEDLHALAAYGRWLERMPEVQRGLKRGFTFYHHRPGRSFVSGPENRNRLLVAASPEDRLADSHWLRQDVDRYLAERAVAEGVELRQESEVVGVAETGEGFDLEVESAGGRRSLTCRYLIDATGPRGVVAEELGARRRPNPARFRSRLVWSHVRGVAAMPEETSFEPGPYPDRRAAVHHLLEEGWLYILEFDDDRASVGLILDETAGPAGGVGEDPQAVWRETMARYPSLERQLRGAVAVRPWAEIPWMQYRRTRAAAGGPGRAWALLPHVFAFFDPLFSTGIAWSLLGVERLGRLFERQGGPGEGGLASYGRLLGLEADQIERLIRGAYLARQEPRAFNAHGFLYFAAVSDEEMRQRLFDEAREAAPWRGFLGAGRPDWESRLEESVSRLAGLARTPVPARGAAVAAYERWVARSIGPHNLIGLGDLGRRNLYPVDLETLVAGASLLGVDEATLRRLLPRLRGGD